MNSHKAGESIAEPADETLWEPVRSRLASLPEIASWPEMVRMVDRETQAKPGFTRYPLLAAQAVGGDAEEALAGSAAIFCALLSIHLVDDMLDDDPAGAFHTLGEGQAANLALAFQAAALRLLTDEVADPLARAAVLTNLAQTCLRTAYGQSLAGEGEEAYWQAVEAKTAPLLQAALYLGAVLGGASLALAQELAELGSVLGKIIQIHDDVRDAMAIPAAPDWRDACKNLPILYALTAEAGERERFSALLARIDEPEVLAAAQKILIRSGAIGFCCYQLADLDQRARERLAALPLFDPQPLLALLDHYAEPVRRLLREVASG